MWEIRGGPPSRMDRSFAEEDRLVTALRWRVAAHDAARIASLERAARVSPLVAQILLARQISSPDDVRSFLEPKMADLREPESIPGIPRAVARIARSIDAGERVAVYGDYDADGMTATAILFACLRKLGADVEVVIRSFPGAAAAVDAIASIGIIDTGADKVLIPKSFAKRLGLIPINNITAFLASGEGRPAITYAGILEIPGIGYSQPLEMTAMTEGVDAHHVLLGKNFLQDFLVTIDCANNVCWFTKHGHSPSQMIDDE